MHLRTLFLLILFSITAIHWTNKNSIRTDWKTMGLKGKVKRIKETLLLNESSTLSTLTYRFSSSGLIQEIEIKHPGNDAYLHKFTYDTDGFPAKAIDVSSKGELLCDRILTKEVKGDTFILKSKILFTTSNIPREYEHYYLNDLLVKEKSFYNDSVLESVTEHDYTDKEWEVRTRYFFNDTINIADYTYSKTDAKGNWTLRAETGRLGKGTKISQSREIVYF